MPREARKLSAPEFLNRFAKLARNGRLVVGGVPGLHIRKVGDNASWFLRAMVNGKRCDIGLGSFSKLGLSAARNVARNKHEEIAMGVDPLEAKRKRLEIARKERATGKTFEECAKLFLAAQAVKWENANPKHVQQWHNTLETYAYPKIGKIPVGKIDTDAILEIIEPLWATKTETASRLRGRIEKVLGWATFKKFRSGENPARWKGHLDHHLPLRSEVRKVKHHASLPYAEIGKFMVELRKREGTSARALEFAILHASRSSEVREATWDEFDLERKLWTIPAARMKAKREHVVPLSDAAVAVIKTQKALPRLEGVPGPAYVFAAPRGGVMPDQVFAKLFERMGYPSLTQHGFRSTFREWAGEVSKHPREVVEHALAHQLADKAEAAYQRGSLFPKRVLLMNDWAKFCALVPTVGNVHSIASAA